MTDDAPPQQPAERAGPPEPPRRRPPSQSEIRGISTIASLPRDHAATSTPTPDPVPTAAVDGDEDASPAAALPARDGSGDDPAARTDR